jgi:hypothetical protein
MLFPGEAMRDMAGLLASLLSAVTALLPIPIDMVQSGAKRNSFGRSVCRGVHTSRACGAG